MSKSRPQKWQNTCSKWHFYGSPGRPSKEDIDNYRNALKNIRNLQQILILGATPELRDLTSEFNAKTTVADFSINMIEGMLQHAKVADADRENWVKSSWFEMPLKENYFDAILGDGVIRMIRKERLGVFFKKISRLLKLNGHFITRIHFVNDLLFKESVKEIISQILNYYKKNQKAKIYSAIVSMLFDKFFDKNAAKMNISKAIRALDYFNHLGNEKGIKIPESVIKFFPKGENWSVFNEKELYNLLGKFFIIKNIQKASDYLEADFYPVYTLIPFSKFKK